MLGYPVMHIYFIGDSASENRINILAQEAVKNGHTATIAQSGKHTVISCISALFLNMDTIHVHGFKSGIWLSVVLPFLPKVTSIWTVEKSPKTSNAFAFWLLRRILPYITSKYSSVFSATRTTQYQLLSLYGIKTEYIPDGYSMPVLSDIRPAEYGLRKEQYAVALSSNPEELKTISKIFKTFRTNKKLVVFSNRTHYGFKNVDVSTTSRGAQSIIRQAAFVIITDPIYTPLALQAMDTGRIVIATTNSLHEELFGTTALYFDSEDAEGLTKLLGKAIKNKGVNTAAQLRAKNHFTWNTIGHEYIKAYKHKKAVFVPFDSLFRPIGADERTRTSTGYPTWS
jgi:glycosyltransferase involved in cell wall biosynthesis